MKTAKILLIEADAAVRRRLKRQLRAAGYSRIFAAPSPDGAARTVGENPPDVVVLGCLQAVGQTCAEQAARLQARLGAPVVCALAATAEADFRHAAPAETLAPCIVEPFPARVVRAVLETAVFQFATQQELHALKAENARLQTQEARLRKLTEIGFEGIAIHEQGIILECNKALADMFGYTREAFIGENMLKFAAPESREILQRNIQQGYEKPYEGLGLRKDGSTFPVEIIGKDVECEGKRLRVAAAHDISARKQAEEALRKSESSLKKAQEIARIGSWELDLQTNVLHWSDEVYRIFGLKPQEFSASYEAFLNCVHPDDRAQVDAAYRAAVANNSPYEIVHRILRPDGTVRIVHEKSENIVDATGKTIRSIGTVHDITAFKRAEEALQSSESRLRAILDTAADGIITIDAQGRIESYNKAAEKMFGYAEKDVLGKNVKILMPEPYRSRHDADLTKHLANVQKETSFFRHDLEALRKDGTTFPVDLAISTAQHRDRVLFTGIVHDTSERKHSEQLQRAVYHIAEAADSSASLEEIYAAIHRIIQEVMPANNFYISLYDEKANKLRFPYFVAEKESAPEARTPQKGWTEYVLRTGSSRLVHKHVHEEMAARGEVELVGQLSAVWLGVPLITGGKTVGVMALQHYSDAHAYGEREQHMLEYVASQVARTIVRKQAEVALRESEERFRTLVELTPDAIAVHRDGLIVYINSAGVRLYGAASADELIGKPALSFVHPDYTELVKQRVQSVLAGENAPPAEEKFVRLDGQFVDVEVKACATRFEGRQAIQIIARDISARKQAEAQIRKLSQAVEQSPTSIVITDTCGYIEYVNAGFTRVTGYTPEEARGRKPSLLKSGKTPADVYEKLWQTITSGKIWRGEFFNKRKDGTLFWEEAVISPIKNEHGEITHFLGIKEDVTEKKRAIMALQESEEKFRNLAEQSPNMIFIHRDGKLLYANRKCEEIIGYTQEELLAPGFDLGQLSPAEDFWLRAEYVKQQLHHKAHGPREHILITKAGKHIPTLHNPKPILFEGEPAVLDIVTDITELKLLEEQFHRAQKMEALGTLAGGIAHDFNNMLAAIIGYAEMTKYEVPEGSVALENLEAILKAGMRAKELVQQILTFSRKSGHKRKLLRIELLVKETIKLMRGSTPPTVRIEEHIAENCGAVLAAPAQIHQIVMNLCTNACQAMGEDGGCMTISLAPVEIGPESAKPQLHLPAGSYVKLSVRDTGCGMDAATQECIYDPFFTTKTIGKGTGLGLSVVHGIVQALEGTICVHSEPGKGSLFEVYLPRQPLQPATPPSASEAPSAGSGRILVVDDEASFAELAQKMLQRLGYGVTATTRSTNALKMFLQHPNRFDLVIADHLMPEMTGVELVKKILQVRRNLPILFVSGFSENMTPEKARELGVRGILSKPVGLAELAEAVKQALK